MRYHWQQSSSPTALKFNWNAAWMMWMSKVKPEAEMNGSAGPVLYTPKEQAKRREKEMLWNLVQEAKEREDAKQGNHQDQDHQAGAGDRGHRQQASSNGDGRDEGGRRAVAMLQRTNGGGLR